MNATPLTASPSQEAGFVAHPDPWLSHMMGRPALRLEKTAGNTPASLLERLRTEPLFVTTKVPVADLVSVHTLEGLSFHVVDTALTFELAPTAGRSIRSHVRFAVPDDRAAVIEIARDSFVFSRFHLDPAVPRPLADRIKAAWVANYFEGRRGNGLIVAEQDGTVSGFMLLLKVADMLVIDLIAVANRAARKGLARDMIEFATIRGANADDASPAGIRAGTQAANGPSIALYQSMGFRLNDAQYVLHHHGVGGPYTAEGAP